MKKNTMEETVQDNLTFLQENISNMADKAKPFAEKVVKTSKELYQDAVDRLPEGSNKVIGLAAAGLAVGFIGYQLGKSSKSVPLIEKATEASGKLNEQLTPVFKFLKLWMLYRLSV